MSIQDGNRLTLLHRSAQILAMAEVKYHYALNEQGQIVHLIQGGSEQYKSHEYTCIGCGARMIARLGQKRAWHFAHRDNDIHCGTETYLHILAKRLIKEKFDREDSFEVCYYRDVSCSDQSSCPFNKPEECHAWKLSPFDLKQYFDTCVEEQSVDGYIADLLLTSSNKPDREPVLIEIQVSHKSTVQKIESGLRIIEIRIKTEEDIKSLLSSSIVENPDARFGYVKDVETIGFAKFHNFKRKTSTPKPLEMRSVQRFYLFRSGKAIVKDMDDYKLKTCRDIWSKDNDKAIFEASIDCDKFGSITPYDYGFYVARQNGFDVKTCLFCKYHKDGYAFELGENPVFCCLYKKFGTPKFPEHQYAAECTFYCEDKALLDEIHNTIPPIVVASTV